MRFICYFLAMLLAINVTSQVSSTDFVTTWRTYNTGVSGDSSVFIKTNSLFNYNYDIDWNNDGVFDTLGVTGDFTINYPDTGTYTIRIKGLFEHITFGGATFVTTNDNDKLVSIDQWGSQRWKSLENAFMNCRNMHYLAVDTPNLSQVTSLSHLFFNNSHFNSNINFWDVSNVSDFSALFFGTSFNQSLNNWDVSNATNMFQLFARSDFDQDISSWDVSSVTNMYGMFSQTQFNQDISSWDVSIVTNFANMFSYNNMYNQPLNSWDVSSALNMASMFQSASRFNQNLSSWDVALVSNMNGMFNYAIKFDQNISSWDVSNVRNFKSMFSNAAKFDQNIGNWDMALATDISFMFNGAVSFDQDISNWDVSNVTDITAIFQRATSFNQPIGKWTTSSLINFGGAFYLASSFDQNIGNWDISSVSSSNAFFLDGSGMSSNNYDSLLIEWDAKPHQNNLFFGMQGMEYCNGTVARNNLISDGWTFNGDIKKNGCLVTSTDELEDSNQPQLLTIYPNPAQNYLIVNSHKDFVGNQIKIYDLNSGLIREIWIENISQLINIADLPNGIYLFRSDSFSQKVIIKK